MTYPLVLTANQFEPSASLSGNEAVTVFRGENCRVREVGGSTRIEAYLGSKNIGEDYDISGELLTGTLSFDENDTLIRGAGTQFESELHTGQMIYSGGEPLVVNRIISNTEFIAERAPKSSKTHQAARYMLILDELDKTRLVMRRGNVIKTDKNDLIAVGDGLIYRNNVSTGFRASRQPKRFEYQTDGTYIEKPIGFPTVPTVPVMSSVAGGTKKMMNGNYALMFSFWNSATRGFSNPSEIVKTDGGGANLVINSPGTTRFQGDFTNTFSSKNFNDGNVTIATGNINTAAHGFATGDAVKLTTTGVLPVPTTGGLIIPGVTSLYVIVVDANNIKLARTKAAALAGTAITYASAGGGGTHTVHKIPANADGIIVWGTLSGGGVVTTNASNFANGPWFQCQKIKLKDLAAGNLAFVEYLDGECGTVVSGDNQAPADCEFVCEFSNQLFFISALGKRTIAKEDGTSPGNYVLPGKASNREAAPYEWRVTVDEEITGFAKGVGRLFTLTANTIPFVTATGKTEIARLLPTFADMPFTSRPFWTKGGINPYSICVVQGDVYLFTGKMPLVSPSNADEKTVPFELGNSVQDLTQDWFNGYTFVRPDPKTQQVCFIASATKKNTAGFWISEILPYDLQRKKWMPIIPLSDDTRDMIVSGATVVNDRLEILAGGRTSGGGYLLSTFRYDEPAGVPVKMYFALQPIDNNEETLSKIIKSIRLTGKMNSPKVQIHGAQWNGIISIDDIENGTNAIAEIEFPTSYGIQRQFKKKRIIKNLQQWCLRFESTWLGGAEDDGSYKPDRIEEIVLEIDTHGISM